MCGIDDLKDNKLYEAVTQGQSLDAVICLNVSMESMQHFMLIGDKAYRVEMDDVTKRAYVCFNDERQIVTAGEI